MKSYIALLRLHQWVKNGFVFLPMFFGGRLTDAGCWTLSFIVFVAFSLMASAVYCLNDIRDVDADRAHPVKCRRPIASGYVSVPEAAAMTAMLVIASLGVCVLCGLGWPVTAILAL